MSKEKRRELFRIVMVVALALGSVALLPACGRIGAQDGSGSIRVVTNPADATVFCNGVDYGSAPVTIEGLPSGQHLLVVRKDGHREMRTTVNLLQDQHSTQRIELEPMMGLVLVESEPEGADVTIDNSFKGRTPLLIDDIGLGTYSLRVFKDSYFPRELTLRVRDRIPQHISIELPADSAQLNVYSQPSGGRVIVDGASMGVTPLEIDRIRTGSVTVEISRDGYLPHQQEVRLRAGESYDIRADLVPLPSGLTVYTVPDGARVYINDDYKGETPVTVEDLVVGTYDIRVQKRGYESSRRSIDISPGASRIEEFRLNSVSGRIVLVTEPANVRVFLGGEEVGVTEPSDSELISEPLEIDMVEEGSHRLQLMRRGYHHDPKTIDVARNDVVTLHERMERLFIPDTIVRTREGAGGVYRGVLLQTHPNGDVDLETRPGIIVTIPHGEIRSIESLEP